MLNLKWLTGLNGPTGMAIWQDTLYVADIDRLVAIDLQSAKIIAKYPAPDRSPGLNDVAADENGVIYVSGSASRTLYVLKNHQLSSLKKDDKLKDANGVAAAGSNILIAGYYLNRLDPHSLDIESLGLAPEINDLESVEPDSTGGYFITKIGPGPIWHWSESGHLSELINRESYSADVEYVDKLKMLVVPSSKNRLFAFNVNF